MNFFADESVDRQIVDRLRRNGHAGQYVAEMEPGIPDDIVLTSPQDGVFIYVFSRRAQVARYREAGPGAVTVDVASNWEELEDEAVEVVEAQGGALTMTGYYRCDATLAKWATWDS